jgi:hypothetical protein
VKEAEDKLLEFNKTSNIINTMNSKNRNVVKEDMEVDFKRKKQISRIQAATKRLERKV